jgi:hypothetical protein
MLVTYKLKKVMEHAEVSSSFCARSLSSRSFAKKKENFPRQNQIICFKSLESAAGNFNKFNEKKR